MQSQTAKAILSGGCRKSFLAAICFLFFAFSIDAQQLPLKTFTVADGLGSNYVNYIYQDHKNYVWFATGEGLSLFDGYTFKNFDDRDGLPLNIINFVTKDDKGNLWVATSQGIARLNDPETVKFDDAQPLNKKFVNFKITEGDSLLQKVINQVNRILFHRDGSIWCLTDYGLYKARNPDSAELKFEAIFERHTAFSRGAIKDKNGDLWFGVADELMQIRRAEIINHGSIGIPFPKDLITGIEIDAKGRMLVSDINSVFEFLPPDESRRNGEFRRIYSFEEDGGINSMFVDYSGNLWIGTPKGMTKIADDGEETRYVNFGDTRLPDVRAFANDREGNLWISLANYGIKRVMTEAIVNFVSQKQDIKVVGEVFEDPSGNIRVSLPDGSSALVGNGELAEQKVFDLPIRSVPPAWFMRDKRGWFYSSENSLTRIKSPQLQLRNGRVIDVSKYVDSKAEGSRFYEDEKGTLWIAKRDNKIYRGTPDANGVFSFESFPTEAPFGYFGSRIISDGAGGVWLTSPLFLGRFRNREYSSVQISEALPERDPRSIFKDSRGWLWIGNRNKGVSMTHEPAADNPVFVNYSRINSPLSSGAVRSITEDKEGRMYFATDKGINRFDVEKNEWTLFSSKNGLAGDLTYGVLTDSKGFVWAATNAGLSRIDTRLERKSSTFPPIYLANINIAGQNLQLPETGLAEIHDIELESAKNNLTIGFVAPNFQGEDLNYQYRLDGTDSDWSKPSKERSVSFSLLPAGEYRFVVRMVNQNGLISPNSASLEFRILPPLWQRWWFVLGVLTLIGFTIYRLYRFRVSRLLEIERTRTRIATDLHDDIGTDLSKISILSEIVKMQLQNVSEEQTRMLHVIGETSRESVGAMSDIVWAINPRKDSLYDMMRRMRQHAEEVFLEKDVKVKFNAPADGKQKRLSMEIRRELYLIFKESLGNAAKHSNCQSIEIDFQTRRNELFLRISDDGKGFEINENGDGNGLQNIRNRAEKIGAKLDIESEIGKGTVITVLLPQK